MICDVFNLFYRESKSSSLSDEGDIEEEGDSDSGSQPEPLRIRGKGSPIRSTHTV
jgi:hypothetical protein